MPEKTHPVAAKAMDLLLDTVCVVDDKGHFVFVSASCEQLLGYKPDELIGRNMLDLVLPEDREMTLQAAEEIMRGNAQMHFENRYIDKDGRIVDIMWSARWSEDYGVRLAVARDITELKRTTRVQKALYQISEAAHAADGLTMLYHQIHQIIGTLLPAPDFYVVLYDSTATTVQFPYRVRDGQRVGDKLAPQTLRPHSPLAQVFSSGKAVLARQGATDETSHPATVTPLRHNNWLGMPLMSATGIIGALILQSHINECWYSAQDMELLQFVSTQVAHAIDRKQNETRLRHMASHDALTDLPNRALFNDRMDTALKHAQRHHESLALLYLDLNGFKYVNDSLGHAAGDLLLREVARRLGLCVRSSDTIARMGGDEFTVLLTSIRDASVVEAVIAKIHQMLDEHFLLCGEATRIMASVGFAVYPEDGNTREELFRHADARMYASKTRPLQVFKDSGLA